MIAMSMWVAMLHPIKQGLKQTRHSLCQPLDIVAMLHPIKQGLKPTASGGKIWEK